MKSKCNLKVKIKKWGEGIKFPGKLREHHNMITIIDKTDKCMSNGKTNITETLVEGLMSQFCFLVKILW